MRAPRDIPVVGGKAKTHVYLGTQSVVLKRPCERLSYQAT
jgi:hypothetical protein